MADDPFTIATDAGRCLLRIAMRGSWTIDTVEGYRRAVLRAAEGMIAAGCAQDGILALVDARQGDVMQQDVVAAYRDRLSSDNLAPRRLATLVSSSLLKRQVERIAVPNQRLFTDESDAMAWLFEGSAAR